jgi:hypothetical protein
VHNWLQFRLDWRRDYGKRLLELNPQEAQQQVDQVLYPQYWKIVDEPGWEDSLEVDSAEPNP